MSTEARFASIALKDLRPNEYNARRFEENMTPQRQARFEELAASITRNGVIEPLLVRPLPSGLYEVVAGERRYRASLQADLAEVPCMVREVDDDTAFDLMVIENLQREDLTPLEAAQAFQAYLQRHGNTADSVNELASRTGIPAHSIRRQVRILELPAEVLDAWKSGALFQSHMELLTRVGDPAQVLELTRTCLKLKLTVRELGERIGSISPDLERAAFAKDECQTCPYNTSVQSGLFADLTPAGRCGNAVCFEAKQQAFFTENWERSKACERFGTLGFRFGHRLLEEHRTIPSAAETSGRCLQCETFVSVLRLSGAIVSGYDRTCIGPLACFESLYRAPSADRQPEEAQLPEDPASSQPAAARKEPAKKSAPTAAAKPGKTATPPEETGPVFSAPRGEKAREAFFRVAIPEAVGKTGSDDPRVLNLTLLAMAISSPAVRAHLSACFGLDKKAEAKTLYDKVLQIPAEDITRDLQLASLVQLLDASSPGSARQLVAEIYTIDLSREWAFNKEYLDQLSKSELVRIGEEPGVGIWEEPQVKAYRKAHHKGKALMALRREDLNDIILKSGVELAGRVPAEVLGQRKG